MWFEWITPTPFTKFPDPYPSFHASAFCIEQYALGMALEKLLADVRKMNILIVINFSNSQITLTTLFTLFHVVMLLFFHITGNSQMS